MERDSDGEREEAETTNERGGEIERELGEKEMESRGRNDIT